jgi:hypothetical protein
MPVLDLIIGPTIAAGESESDVADCTGGYPVRLTIPPVWTSAVLTFLISSDGDKYNNLHDFQGHEVSVNVTPGAAVLIPDIVSQAMAYFKVRSGTGQNPIAQEDRREFAIAMKNLTTS